MFKTLYHILTDQSRGKDVEILFDSGHGTTGAKRQRLLEQSKGEYVCFIDDDDIVIDSYVTDILAAIDEKPDVVGFKGWMFTDGRRQTEWIISNSLPYESCLIRKKIVYLRYPNHLSPIKREIALQIGFPDLTNGEDYDYATRLKKSGLVKTEVFIDKHMYNYLFRSNK